MNDAATQVRNRIMRATAELLAQGGREAASTRAVSAAAGVQAPAIYRQFGDMQGLLDVVAHETFAQYVLERATQAVSEDPLDDLRRGWDINVAFGLANPAVYAVLHSGQKAPEVTSTSQEGYAILHALVNRVAQSGRLRVSVPHAVQMIAAAGKGVTLTLIGLPAERRDLQLSISMREAVLSAIVSAPASSHTLITITGTERVAARAIALHAVLDEAPEVLSEAERQLMGEWLERLTKTAPTLAEP